MEEKKTAVSGLERECFVRIKKPFYDNLIKKTEGSDIEDSLKFTVRCYVSKKKKRAPSEGQSSSSNIPENRIEVSEIRKKENNVWQSYRPLNTIKWGGAKYVCMVCTGQMYRKYHQRKKGSGYFLRALHCIKCGEEFTIYWFLKELREKRNAYQWVCEGCFHPYNKHKKLVAHQKSNALCSVYLKD